MTSRGAALLLMHAHDHIWKDRRIDLKSRSQSCQLIMDLIVTVITGWRDSRNRTVTELIYDPNIKQLVFAYESILTEMRTHSAANPLIRQWVDKLDYERDEFVQSVVRLVQSAGDVQ